MLPLLAVCACVASAACLSPVDYIAQNMDITYQVVDNNGTVSRAVITLTNNGDQDIPAQGWSLYHCSVRMYTALEQGALTSSPLGASGVLVQHVNGCLFKLTPEQGVFVTILPGASRELHSMVDAWISARTDIMPNWYVADPSGHSAVVDATRDLSFVTDFTTENQTRRAPDDIYKPFTAEQRYDIYNAYQKDLAEPLPSRTVIPQPASTRLEEGWRTFVPADWVVVAEDWLAPEAAYLAESLGVVVSTSVPASNFIYLRSDPVMLAGAVHCADLAEYHEIELPQEADRITVHARSARAAFYAGQTLRQLLRQPSIPTGFISDCGRFAYRGLMLDVARNFYPKQDILRVLDVMSNYKLTTLHLHLTDDEGWRLELPTLSELTQVGGRRCHSASPHVCVLPQLGSDPAGGDQGSGYYTAQDYTDILRHATRRHIQVIPEFDMPGHSHAVIKAMEAHTQNTGSSEFLLSEEGDSSDYLSIQMFTDNAINPCLESTYTFIGELISQVKAMHREAGHPLGVFHFGGDEVAKGAWINSTACQQTLQDRDWKQYFTERVALEAHEQGLELAAWEDGLADHDHKPYNITLFPQDKVTGYAWNNIWEWGGGARAYELANAGYKVVLAHGTHLYFDHPAEPDPHDRGFYWATRATPAEKVFKYTPTDIYANMYDDRMGRRLDREELCKTVSCVELERPQNIVGMQAQLWGETVRTWSQLGEMLFPRVLAAAERAWHQADWETADPSGAPAQNAWGNFAQSLGLFHLPLLEEMGVTYHLRPPGVRVKDGTAHALSEFPGQPILSRGAEGEPWTPLPRSGLVLVPGGQTRQFVVASHDGTRHSRVVTVTGSASPGGWMPVSTSSRVASQAVVTLAICIVSCAYLHI